MWCKRHFEPLRAAWPKGAAEAMVGLFNATVEDERFFRLTEGKQSNFNDALKDLKPVCCFIGDKLCKEILKRALAGETYKAPAGWKPPKAR